MMRFAPLVLAALVSACPEPTPPPPAPVWQRVHDDLPGALLRVWGTSSRDVYAVGADGDGLGSLLLHFDGNDWERLDTGTNGDLWWIDQVGPDDIRIVGEAGVILRYRPSTKTFEQRPAPRAVTLFGVWGASSSDVWYVGGVPAGGFGVVWRDDGTTVRDASPTITATSSGALLKVHGFGPSSVVITGQLGASGFWNGTSFTEPDTGTPYSLFTVHGTRADRTYAVGGGADGVMLAWNGTRWTNETPPETPPLNGLWALDDEHVLAAGFNGRVFERSAAMGWREIELETPPTYSDLHSIWVDDEGHIWAAGGRLASDPPADGVLIRYGPPISSNIR